MNKEDLSQFGIEEIIQYTLDHYQEYFRKLIILFQTFDRTGMEKEEILAEFVLFLLERGAAPLYAYAGKSPYRSYIIVLFRNWLSRFLQTNELKNVRETNAEYNLFRFRVAGSIDSAKNIEEKHSSVENEVLEREKAARMNFIFFMLKECISKIDEKWRNYIDMIFTEKINISDIAMFEQIKLRTAYNRFYSKLKKIKRCLNKKGIHAEDL